MRALRALLGLAALIAVGVALAQTWDRTRAISLPSWPELVGAGALIAVGLACGARGWVHLLERHASRELKASFYLSQLGKYLPGAIWQPAGQLTFAIEAGVPAGVASTAVPVYMLTLIAAGATVGLGVMIVGDDMGAARWLPLTGLGFVALLRRDWMSRLLDRAHQRWPRVPAGDVVPPQRAILGSYVWGIGVMVTTGAGFYLLASNLESLDVAATISAFALAWTVGFLALPFPAGLGVREAVLVGVLAASSSGLLAASIAYRLVSIVTELAVAGVSRLRR